MGRKKVTFNDKVLQQDLIRFGNIFCETVAEESKYYIWQFANEQINEYYDEYEPLRYKRTDQEKKYSFHIFSERTNNSYRGGIVFDNSAIFHEKAGVSEDYIENMVWQLGYHGWWRSWKKAKGIEGGPWIPINGEPNRFGNIQDFVKGDEFPKEKIMGIALSKAKKQKYSILHFD